MPYLEQLVRAFAAERGLSWLVRSETALGPLLPLQPLLPARRWPIRRADDLVVLDLSLHMLTMDPFTRGHILRRTGSDATLVIHFQPQAIAEEAFAETSPTDQPSPLPVGALPAQSRHAGESRLAYRMPAGVDTIDFTLAAVLDAMAQWPLAVVPWEQSGLATGLHLGLYQIAAEIAGLLPQEHTERATRAVRRAAARAAAGVGRTLAGDAIAEAGEALHREVSAAAAGLNLDQDQSSALRVQAELQLAGDLVARAGTRLAPDELLDVFPGLRVFYVPRRPPATVTAIELPYRLVQSPPADAVFSHARAPVTLGGRTELWHTRLGVRADGVVLDATERPSTMAAIWSPDYPAEGGEPGFTTSLTAQDRREIVKLTADGTGVLPGLSLPYVPVPSRVDRLMLTALGGWLDLDGKWKVTPANEAGYRLSLESWKHHAALGRDWFVETVRAGEVLPFAHRAVVVTITERIFQDEPGGAGRVAVLRQRVFLEIREPLRSYPDPTQPFRGRDFPFRTVEILTKRTPNLMPFGPGESIESFWPRVAGPPGPTDFRFEIRATDIGGNVVRFDVPLRFVSVAVPIEPAIQQYNGPDQDVPSRTTAPLNGQALQLAPAANRVDAAGAPDPGDVVYPVTQLRFGASAPTSAPPKGSPLPRCHPLFRTLNVISTALSQLTGNDAPGEMAFALVYRNDGFDPATNKAELLLATAGAAILADFAAKSHADKAGGIVTPNFGVSGTSRALGLVGGDTNLLAGGTFDPANFFPSAKIFGGIDLKDLLAPVVVVLAGATVPKLRTTRTREMIETVFEHRVENVPKSVPLLKVNERGTSKLDIKALMRAYFRVEDPKLGPIGSGPGGAGGKPPGLKEPEAEAEATLTWFKLNFFGCVIVSFDFFKFRVTAKEGMDPKHKLADPDGVVFGGPLAFVDTLRHMLSGDKSSGGSGGPFKVEPIFKPELSGVTVGVKLGVVEIPVGIFVMKNLMVSTAVKLPFDGKPLSLQFGFAERANPFQLVVSLLGGGGFVVIGLDTEHGVQEIEAALEFGAFAEVNFGIASGSIYVKAGIYIYWNQPEEVTTLKGYVEMGGEVQALGIISVSIVLHLSLGFYKIGTVSEVRGQATLVIEVELLFFSVSVNVTVERRFAGSEADPTFADLIPSAATWDAYADAFA